MLGRMIASAALLVAGEPAGLRLPHHSPQSARRGRIACFPWPWAAMTFPWRALVYHGLGRKGHAWRLSVIPCTILSVGRMKAG
jgi:hypothetical protein